MLDLCEQTINHWPKTLYASINKDPAVECFSEFRGKKVNTVSGFIAPPWGAQCV